MTTGTVLTASLQQLTFLLVIAVPVVRMRLIMHTPPIAFCHHESLAILNALYTAPSPLYDYSATSNNVIIIGLIQIIGLISII